MALRVGLAGLGVRGGTRLCRHWNPDPDRETDRGRCPWCDPVDASLPRAGGANRSGRPYEDLVSITGLPTGGIVTNHLVNWLSPLEQRKITVTGELGAFVVDTLTADLTYYANGLVETRWDTVSRFRGVSEGDVVRYAFAKPEPLRSEHEAFRDAVLGEPAEIVTLEDGLETVRVAQAVLDSVESGRTVRL